MRNKASESPSDPGRFRYNESANTPQYFYPDGVHLNPTGAKYYATLIVQALEAPLPQVQATAPTG
jgi:lysophospholipase L1-like esterase